MAKLSMVTVDTPDARALATWWADRLGGHIVVDMDGYYCIVQAPEVPIALGFQYVENAAPGKNRIHFDFNRSPEEDREEMIAQWVAAGAEHLGRRGEEGFFWDTFADPQGNQFCIADPESHA